jgi:hypothetical protein
MLGLLSVWMVVSVLGWLLGWLDEWKYSSVNFFQIFWLNFKFSGLDKFIQLIRVYPSSKFSIVTGFG